MSRSYKTVGVYIDNSGRGGRIYKRFAKRQAARKVRHAKDALYNGGSGRKLFDSWDIIDYKTYANDDDPRPWKAYAK